MPEIKQGFSSGRMNKDLDERLIPNGEYRDAMNVQVSTSDDSDVGVVQNVLGNVKLSNIPTDPFSVLKCVGTISDEKTNSVYWFTTNENESIELLDGEFTVPENALPTPDNWGTRAQNLSSAFQNLRIDTIAEFSVNQTSPVVVDVYNVDIHADYTSLFNFIPPTGTFIDSIQVFDLNFNQEEVIYIKEGMEIIVFCDDGSGEFINSVSGLNLKVQEIIGNEIIFNKPITSAQLQPANTQLLGFRFKSLRALNFISKNIITGISIIDDFLFWTDNFSEPKKINISDCKEGTLDFTTPTKLIVEDRDINLNSNIYLEEKHITVIKPSPLNPLFVKTESAAQKNTNFIAHKTTGTTGVTNSTNFVSSGTTLLQPGQTHWMSIINQQNSLLDINNGDVLLLKSISTNIGASVSAGVFPVVDAEIRAVVNNFSFTVPNAAGIGQQININITIQAISPDTPVGTNLVFAGSLEEKENNLFEDKFVRFSYRWKYKDGEYSTFAPFTTVAFDPGIFNLHPTVGYNLAMENTAYNITLQDFITPDLPDDVIELDLLYKDSVSPNIYIVDSLKYKDTNPNSGLNPWRSQGSTADLVDAGILTSSINSDIRGSYSLKSESIFKILPSNQLIRTFDDVPRKAKSLDITANRLIYGNYVKDYNLVKTANEKWDFLVDQFTTIKYLAETKSNRIGAPSIKSLREYQIGIVYRDTYGRETPVFTNSEASHRVPKTKSSQTSKLRINPGNHPTNKEIEYYKFYIKESSNEYYNMVVDRVYNAEDGNVWLSFPSAERNKIDEDTYLILKKGRGQNNVVEDTTKYKVLAISNNAPDFVKTRKALLGKLPLSPQTIHFPANNELDQTFDGATTVRTPVNFSNSNVDLEAVDSFTIILDNDDASTDSLRDKYATLNFGDLFSSEITNVNTRYRIRFVNESKNLKSRFYNVVSVMQTNVRDVELRGQTPQLAFNHESDEGRFNFVLEQPIRPDTGGEANSLGHFIMNTTGAVDGSSTLNSNCFIEFYDYKVRNKPEFDGRFFVKIFKDVLITEQVLPTQANNKRQVVASRSLHYINGSNFDLGASISNSSVNGTISSNTTDFDTLEHWKRFATQNGSELAKGRWFVDEAYYYAKAEPPTTSSSSTLVCSADTHDDLDFGLGSPIGVAFTAAGTLSSNLSDFRNKGVRFETDYVSDLPAGTRTGTPIANAKSSIDIAYSYISNSDYDPLPSQDLDMLFSFKPGNFIQFNSNATVYKIIAVASANYVNANLNTSTGISSNAHSSSINLEQQRRVVFRLHLDRDFAVDPIGDCLTDPTPDNNSLNFRVFASFSSALDDENEIPDFPAIFETEPKEDVDLDIYYEASQNYPLKFTKQNAQLYIPIGTEVKAHNSLGVTNAGSTLDQNSTNAMIITDHVEGYITISNVNNTGALLLFHGDLLELTHPLHKTKLTIAIDHPSGPGFFYSNTDEVRINPSAGGDKQLNWFNCFSFSNGVESDRIRDTFNLPRLDKGVKVSTVTEKAYGEQRLEGGLIFSGIYNGKNSINNLNQFISAEGITKDLDPTYGSIQKLFARNSDLVAFCEDKIVKIYADKDILFNADGNTQLTASNRVLGQAQPFIGDYGISQNPESFSKESYRAYFTDKQRGAVLRLSMDGLTNISDYGMKDWFKDRLKNARTLIGSYDDKKSEYNLTLEILPTSKVREQHTVTYKESVNGWSSFKSFIQELGGSVSNDYYTFKKGQIYKHHIEGVHNTFYSDVTDAESTESSVTFVFNESPSSIKNFKTLNYEGTQSKVRRDNSNDVFTQMYTGYYNLQDKEGWFAEYVQTDQDIGAVNEFKKKENKWFNYIKGRTGLNEGSNINVGDIVDIDTDKFNFQGLGSSNDYTGLVSVQKLIIKDSNDTD